MYTVHFDKYPQNRLDTLIVLYMHRSKLNIWTKDAVFTKKF